MNLLRKYFVSVRRLYLFMPFKPDAFHTQKFKPEIFNTNGILSNWLLILINVQVTLCTINMFSVNDQISVSVNNNLQHI